jgi:hypothetical protein
MSRRTKRWLIGIAVVAIAVVVIVRLVQVNTKRASPMEQLTFWVGDLQIDIEYSRPYKKGRTIFGGLVPYGKVWRTGANEATTFTVNKPIAFGGKTVPTGKYTIWTIPGPQQWTVILNGKMYGWGIDSDGNASRDPMADVAKANVPVIPLAEPAEQFTMEVGGDPTSLMMKWDTVMVSVPLE